MSDYDAVPYASRPLSMTHPDRLAMVGRLLGLDTPLPSRARVLEVGCSTGGNLIPLAVASPEASFVGVDLSPVQIELAREAAAPFGLSNLDLRAGDLTAIDASWGPFDYVIAHGVWSWVPPEVQERLFAVCAERLTDNGVAYVSHNVQPGWRTRLVLRDVMLLHAEGIEDAAARIAAAREAAALVAGVLAVERSDPSMVALRRQAEAIPDHRDAYVLHEYLAPHNEAVWFRDFTRRAAAHGLAFLADARFARSLPMHLPAQAQAFLATLPDIALVEQYCDVFRNRAFRCTLLVHEGAPVDRDVGWRCALPLHFARHDRLETMGIDAGELAPDSTPTRAAFDLLAERWPESMPFEALLSAAHDRCGGQGPLDPHRPELARRLLLAYANGLVLPRREPSPAVRLGPRPEVFAVARHQAGMGLDRLTTTRHVRVKVNAQEAEILALLDGTHTRDEIVALGHAPRLVDGTLANAEQHALLVG